MPRPLWQVTATHQTLLDHVVITRGLRQHLHHASLTTVLVQIGAVQRAYVALAGCGACPDQPCLPGCRAALLDRTLQAAGAGALRPVSHGLAARPYQRVALAVPGRAASPLDHTLLNGCNDARLTLHWATWRGWITAVALLADAAPDADVAETFRCWGWRPLPLPATLLLAWARASLPPMLPIARAWPHDPMLLLPRPPELSACASHGDARLAGIAPREPTLPAAPVDSLLATWLRAVLAGQREISVDAAAHAVVATDGDSSLWPAGPGDMHAAALARLVPQLLHEPTLRSERKGQAGLTKGRLVGLRVPGLTEPVARALMVWFDAAGVLAPPQDSQGPWRAPRPFVTDDLDQIAARLRATPLPTADAVQAAYGANT